MIRSFFHMLKKFLYIYRISYYTPEFTIYSTYNFYYAHYHAKQPK